MKWSNPIEQRHAPLHRRAWAKVNLTLHVTARRADGFHDLDSLVVFAGIGDELTIAPGSDLQLLIEGPFAKSLESPASGAAPGAAGSRARSENLVLLAARETVSSELRHATHNYRPGMATPFVGKHGTRSAPGNERQ